MKVFSCLDQYVDWWDRQEEDPEPLLSLRSIQSESKMSNKKIVFALSPQWPVYRDSRVPVHRWNYLHSHTYVVALPSEHHLLPQVASADARRTR